MRRGYLIGSFLLMAGAAAFANGTSDGAMGDKAAKDSGPVTVQWYQFQIEVADQVNVMTKAYMAEHPGIRIETTILSDPYWDQLKVRAAANDMPDSFMTDGYSRIRTYHQFVKDISSDPLSAKILDAAKPAVSLDGRIMGLPVQMSGWGIIYNKSLFEKAGIRIPVTYPELVKACEVLQSNGITPFANQYGDSWLLGQLIGSSVGKIENPERFVADVSAGKARFADQPMLKRSIEILDLTLKYGQKNSLNDKWNEACTLMGTEKGAMMLEGIWVYDTIKSVNPDIRLGIMALPFTDNPADTKLSADVNGVYHIRSNGKKEALVHDIYDWLYNSPSGQKFFADCKFIPAYKGISTGLNDVSKDANGYIQAGKTSIFGWLISPGSFQFESGSVYQEYILGKYDASTVLPALDAVWAKLTAK